MILSTLCYIEKDGCWLMLPRPKKKNGNFHRGSAKSCTKC